MKRLWVSIFLICNLANAGAEAPKAFQRPEDPNNKDFLAINLRITPVHGLVLVQGFELESLQPKLVCRFETAPDSPTPDQYMPETTTHLTLTTNQGPPVYRIDVAEMQLAAKSEPAVPLRSCSYQLWIVGRVAAPARPGMPPTLAPVEETRGYVDLMGDSLKDMGHAELARFGASPELGKFLSNALQPLLLTYDPAAKLFRARLSADPLPPIEAPPAKPVRINVLLDQY